MVHQLSEAVTNHRAWLTHLFDVGVASCHPRTVLPPLLPRDAPRGKNIVLGAGKAAAAMAAATSDTLAGDTVGLVVTRYGHAEKTQTGSIEVIEARHPVPDDQSIVAARRMLDLAATATADDRIVFVFSGGGSALLCAPIAGVTPEQKQTVTRHLLYSGANIAEINLVRKHLSTIKGGGLAVCGGDADMHTFVISDVVGDDPADVASGPSIGIDRDVDAAQAVLERYAPPHLAELTTAMHAHETASPKPHPVTVVATAHQALAAIANEASANGWQSIIVDDDIEGDATLVGREHAALARRYRKSARRTALISGGELTVKVNNPSGRGGPNLEYLTSLAIALNAEHGIEAIACDSDGLDGSEDNAGGYISPSTLPRARAAGVDPKQTLAKNNTYELLSATGDLIITGPTQTNVNDIRVILVDPQTA